MKHLADIEKMDLVSLEAAAAGADAKVPEGLEQRIESALAAAALTGESAPAGAGAAARPAMLDADGASAPLHADVVPANPETDARPANLDASVAPAPLHADGAQANPETDARPATLVARPGGRKRLWLPLAGIAAAAAVALLLILPRTGQSQLKDTYDDPGLAYAQVEETFKLISSKMADGVALAAESGKQAGSPARIIDKINRK